MFRCLPRKLVVSFVVVTFISLILLPTQVLARTVNPLARVNTIEPLEPSKFNELYLGVSLNGYNTKNISLFLQDEEGKLYIQKDELEGYGLPLPEGTTVEYEGNVYYPLASFSQHINKLDTQNLTIDLNVPADKFRPHTYQADTDEFVKASLPKMGGFFNYSLNGSQSGDLTQGNAFLEPGVFFAAGSLASGFLSLNNNYQSSFTRLNTTWETDYPDKMVSLYAGDSYGVSGLWGRGVNFGGIQWSTNFGTQPAFITAPLPIYKGQATMPSVIDLYVNNNLLSQESVPAGQFTISEIPVINGSGDLNIVITDALGNKQTLTVPYYLSNTLLKPGLHDYSIEAGFIRLNYGKESNDYGQFMTAVTDRVGLNEILTGEWRIEALLNQQTIGGGAIYQLGEWATINAAAAASHSEFGAGGLVELALSHQAQYNISLGVNVTATSPNFTQLGFGQNTVAPSFQGQYFAAAPMHEFGSLSLAYTQQNNREKENLGFLSGTYLVTIAKNWALSLSAMSQIQGGSNTTASLVVSRMIGEYTYVNLGGNARKDGNPQGYGQLSQALPVGPGWGYNLYASPGENESFTANLSGQNEIGTATLGGAYQSNQVSYRAQVSGAVAVIDNDFYLARQLGPAFGVVQVGDYENVRIYNYNQVVDVTDKNGKAFMPNLLPYQNNSIGVEVNDLPIGTEIYSADLNLIPYFQSGYLVEFPVESVYSVTARLVDTQGNALPSGTVIRSIETNNQAFVADNGDIYLNKLNKGINSYIVSLKDKACTFSINFKPDPDDEMPDLGTLVCKPASP